MNEMMNRRRRMPTSDRRDSTTVASAGAATLDWLAAAAIALTVLVATAGIDFQVGRLSIRAHSSARLLVVVLLLLGVRWRAGISHWPTWLTRMACLVAITGSASTWFRFLLTTVGGADSWGYVSASRLLASGHLVETAPIADWISAANRLAIASPLGWAPAPDGSGIVPTYPLGLPMLITVFSAIGGGDAAFFVAPVAAAITLALVYRLTRRWYSAETALFASAFVAWNPVFIAYAKQPMSDMAATMWMMLAMVLASRVSLVSGCVAGLAAGMAVMTRPVLLVAAAVIPFIANRVDDSRKRPLMAAAGAAIGVVEQMLIQTALFGSPLSTGYGAASGLFSLSFAATNLSLYTRHGWDVVGPLWVPGLILGLCAARPEPRRSTLLIFAAVALPYVFYLPFDHWETLRFLLPGLVPLTILAADGLGHVARLQKPSMISSALVMVFLAIVAGGSERLLRASSAWDIASIEARYPLAGEWINVNTPPTSVVLANQHSGSLRYYGKRPTLRWDFVEPARLETTVRELQSRGATVYVALEGDEVRMFDQRFAGVIDRLVVDPVGHIRNVTFLRIR